MDKTKPYHIHFGGLKAGMHPFHFTIDEAFFELFEESEVKSGKVDVDVEMEKKEGMLIIGFTFNGSVAVHCDRCFDIYDQPIIGSEQLVVKFAAEASEEDDIVFLTFDTRHINLAPHIYEFIHLLIPMRRIHPDTAFCNPETIKRLQQLSSDTDTLL